MSTEMPPTPDVAEKSKKHKKEKGKPQHGTKKRQREEEVQAADRDSKRGQRPAKKHKAHEQKTGLNDKVKQSVRHLNEHTPFVQRTSSFYLPLAPCVYAFPLAGLCAEHISPLLLTYHPPLRGVVLSYDNARLSEGPPGEDDDSDDNYVSEAVVLSESVGEYAVTFVWLTVDFLLFRPRKGSYLEGYVNLQNESLLGLICYNYFNAGIERSRLPADWRWVEGVDRDGRESVGAPTLEESGGYFVNGGGEKVQGRIVFQVEDFEATAGSESGAGTLSIIGTLVEGETE